MVSLCILQLHLERVSLIFCSCIDACYDAVQLVLHAARSFAPNPERFFFLNCPFPAPCPCPYSYPSLTIPFPCFFAIKHHICSVCLQESQNFCTVAVLGASIIRVQIKRETDNTCRYSPHPRSCCPLLGFLLGPYTASDTAQFMTWSRGVNVEVVSGVMRCLYG